MTYSGQMTYRGKNDDDGLSPEIWHDCDLDLMALAGSNYGYTFSDEFLSVLADKYTATQGGGAGTFAATDGAGGLVIADAGDNDAGDGINIQFGGGEMFKFAANKQVWFEARFKIMTAHPDFFIGLANTDTTIITAVPAISATDYLGLLSLTGDSVLLSAGSKASTATTNAFNGGTALTAGTYYKLGFKTDGVGTALFYLDGVEDANSIVTANLSILEMRPSLVVQSCGTGTPAVHLDWISVAQKR